MIWQGDTKLSSHPTRAFVFFGVLVASTVGIALGAVTAASASVPHIVAVQSTVTFGKVPVGSPTSQAVFQLENESSSTETVNLSTGIVVSGPGASDYSTITPNQEDGGFACPGPISGNVLTLTAGEVCQFFVTFTPSALGDRSATATITASDSTQATVEFSGSGGPTVSLAPSSENYGNITLGAASSGTEGFIVTNDAAVTDTINLSTDVSFTGPGADDYIVLPYSGCPGDGVNLVVLTSGHSCTLLVIFVPGALGDRPATLTLQGLYGTSASVGVDGTGTIGYYEVSSAGKVAAFGDAALYGDASKEPLNHPIVGMAQTGDNGGYWLVASDGGIFSYGDAQFYGSTGAIHLNKPIVGMAATPDAGGYWMVASDGGIFSFGDAQFHGSTGAIHLNKPIVGMATTPDGGGYWLVASDGGIFSFGDAQFYGSTGAIHLNQPIVGMATTPDGGGYWLVASDGGIFSFGDAQFYGSTGAIRLNKPIVGMAAMPDGLGYWFAAADGGLFNYGDAPFHGAATGQIGNVVAIVTDGAPTLQASAGLPAVRHASIHVLQHRLEK
jgi:hypothetical protein